MLSIISSGSRISRVEFHGFRHGSMRQSSSPRALFPKGNAMPNYRIYQIDKNDRVISRKEIVAPTDEAALEAAMQYLGDVDVEVWDHARKVGRLGKNNRRP
jgi:hypothetical protein